LKILVTGGAGFVGSHLVIALIQAFTGSQVIALDNLKRQCRSKIYRASALVGVEYIHGDVRNPADRDFI